MKPRINPYAAPTTACGQTRNPKSTGSLSISLVSGIGVLAFIAFTMILLRSSSSDQKAGIMFLANVPVLIGLAISSFRSIRISVYLAISAACVQIAITITMLIRSVGDALTVIGINSAIVFACLAIAVWACWLQRRSVLAKSFTQDNGQPSNL